MRGQGRRFGQACEEGIAVDTVGSPAAREPKVQMTDPSRRPPVPREPLARDFIEHNPEDQVALDGEVLLNNLRKSRRGAAAGPSGLIGEHLRVILDSERDSVAFCEFERVLAVGEVPHEVMKAIRLGRMTALVLPESVGCNFSVPSLLDERGFRQNLSASRSKLTAGWKLRISYGSRSRAGRLVTLCLLHFVSFLMVRRGRTKTQIIRGPRPPSAQWPRATRQSQKQARNLSAASGSRSLQL